MRFLSKSDYIGPSMKPLLKTGDGLIFNSDIIFEDLRQGDVICFKSPTDGIHVIHRIVAFNPEGLITRGDNNLANDTDPVTPEMNPVLLTNIRRGSKTLVIHGGTLGIAIHWKNQMRRMIFFHFISPLISTLRRITGSQSNIKLLYRLCLLDKKILVSEFNRNGKIECLLISGRRKIGHMKDDGKWHIRIPWRFFIDPKKLVKNEDRIYSETE